MDYRITSKKIDYGLIISIAQDLNNKLRRGTNTKNVILQAKIKHSGDGIPDGIYFSADEPQLAEFVLNEVKRVAVKNHAPKTNFFLEGIVSEEKPDSASTEQKKVKEQMQLKEKNYTQAEVDAMLEGFQIYEEERNNANARVKELGELVAKLTEENNSLKNSRISMQSVYDYIFKSDIETLAEISGQYELYINQLRESGFSEQTLKKTIDNPSIPFEETQEYLSIKDICVIAKEIIETARKAEQDNPVLKGKINVSEEEKIIKNFESKKRKYEEITSQIKTIAELIGDESINYFIKKYNEDGKTIIEIRTPVKKERENKTLEKMIKQNTEVILQSLGYEIHSAGADLLSYKLISTQPANESYLRTIAALNQGQITSGCPYNSGFVINIVPELGGREVIAKREFVAEEKKALIEEKSEEYTLEMLTPKYYELTERVFTELGITLAQDPSIYFERINAVHPVNILLIPATMLAIGKETRKRSEILEKIEELVPEAGKFKTSTNSVDFLLLKNEIFKNLIKKEGRGRYYLNFETEHSYTPK